MMIAPGDAAGEQGVAAEEGKVEGKPGKPGKAGKTGKAGSKKVQAKAQATLEMTAGALVLVPAAAAAAQVGRCGLNPG